MPPTLKELENDVAKLAAEIKPLAMRAKAGEDFSEDEEREYEERRTKLETVSNEYQQAKVRADAADAALQIDKDFNQPGGRKTVSRTDGEQPTQRPTRADMGYQFTHSEAYEDYRSRPTGRSGRLKIGSFYERNQDQVEDMEQRTLIWTAATSGLVNGDRLTGVYRPVLQPFQVRMRDVLINGRTDSNAIEYVQELVFTNAAAETAEAVSTATGAKPESALTFQVATDNVATIAHWVPITRQVIDDAAQMETYVNGRLIEGLKLREDAEIVNGNGTPPNIQGLMNRTGIGNLDATYWTGNPLPTVAAAANKADRIRRAKKYTMVTGLANPSFVVLHPDDFEQMDELKTTTGEYLFSNPTDYNVIPRLWGLTVVESTSITANNFLVGDGTMAAIFDKMDAQIFVADQHSDFFIRNIFVILAEERLALAVFRPAAFTKGVLS